MGQMNYINTENTINGCNCMKNSTRDSTTRVIPLGQCSVQGLETCHILVLQFEKLNSKTLPFCDNYSN